MESTRYFIDPFDVLLLRGNKLFGDPGSFGEGLMPPWPSVAAGALRSALLADRGYDLAAFARGEITNDQELGTPACPGTFTLTGFHLARRGADDRIETLHPMPADLSAHIDSGEIEVRRVTPRAVGGGITSSAATPTLAVLAETDRGKPASGYWLTSAGWMAYLAGKSVTSRHLVPSSDLWTLDTRIGIALDPVQRSAATGALFISQAMSPRKREHVPAVHGACNGARCDVQPFDVGFFVEVAGATPPETLTLRFGGDGRAAQATRVETATVPEPDYDAVIAARRCRLILTTPGLFAGGWYPTGVTGNGDGRGLVFSLHGVTGRIVCAAVPRADIVSGFDVAERRPKPAQRAAPAGSVYWLEELDTTPDALRKLAARGLWSDPVENDTRRAEGFNRFTFAQWGD